MRFVSLFLMLVLSCSAVLAGRVKQVSPRFVFEGSKVRIRGKGINTKANPITVQLVDGAGENFGSALTTTGNNKAGFRATIPDVGFDQTFNLKVTGGLIKDTVNGETFPIVVFNKPDLTSPGVANGGTLTVGNLLATAVVFNNTSLSGDANGTLLWNGMSFIDKSGILTSERITLNGIALSTGASSNLTWNSHVIATSAGGVIASAIDNAGNTLAVGSSLDLNLNGATLSLDTDNGVTSSSFVVPPTGTTSGLLRGEYDFGVDGGVTGTISLRNAVLPQYARVTRAWYEVLTTFTSATDASSIGITIPSNDADGILAPVAINSGGNPWDAGIHGTIQDGLVTNISERCTAARTVGLTVTGEALTAGRAVFYIEYVLTKI